MASAEENYPPAENGSELDDSTLTMLLQDKTANAHLVTVADLVDTRGQSAQCHCLFLVGEKRECGPKTSVLLATLAGEVVDLASVAKCLGLRRGLKPGPAELCENTMRRKKDEYLTPLAACSNPTGTRVAFSVAMKLAKVSLLMRFSPLEAIRTNYAGLVRILRDCGVRVDEDVACSAAALKNVVPMPTKAAAATAAAVEASLEGYAGEIRWVNEEMAQNSELMHGFRDLKRAQDAQVSDHIIAEGSDGVRLLLGSDLSVRRLLMKPSLFAGLRANLEARAHRGLELPLVLLCEPSLMEAITGITAKHASATIALARRPAPAESVVEVLPKDCHDQDRVLRVLAVEGLDEEVVGAVFRDASAFGVHVVLLADDCGDHFSRRSTRVSMGHVFRVPAVRGNLPLILQQLREEFAVSTIAATSSEDVPESEAEQGLPGQPVFLDSVSKIPRRWACVIGPDGPAMSSGLREACQAQIAVRLALPGCPIGVGVLTSVLLNGFVEREHCVGSGCSGCTAGANTHLILKPNTFLQQSMSARG